MRVGTSAATRPAVCSGGAPPRLRATDAWHCVRPLPLLAIGWRAGGGDCFRTPCPPFAASPTPPAPLAAAGAARHHVPSSPNPQSFRGCPPIPSDVGQGPDPHVVPNERCAAASCLVVLPLVGARSVGERGMSVATLTIAPCLRPPPTPKRGLGRASFEQGGEGGRGFWTQNLVYQKWPDQIFLIVNFVFSRDGHFGLGRGGGGFGGGVPAPPGL